MPVNTALNYFEVDYAHLAPGLWSYKSLLYPIYSNKNYSVQVVPYQKSWLTGQSMIIISCQQHCE